VKELDNKIYNILETKLEAYHLLKYEEIEFIIKLEIKFENFGKLEIENM